MRCGQPQHHHLGQGGLDCQAESHHGDCHWSLAETGQTMATSTTLLSLQLLIASLADHFIRVSPSNLIVAKGNSLNSTKNPLVPGSFATPYTDLQDF